MGFDGPESGWLSWHPGKDIGITCAIAECGLHWRASIDLLTLLSEDRQLMGVRAAAARKAGCVREGLGKAPCLARIEITRPPRQYAEIPFHDPASKRKLTDASKMKVGDFQDWHMLFGVCRACRRIYFVDRHKLARRFPADRKLGDLATKLACKACRNRMGNLFAVTAAPR
ncbi:hypothetical protein [Rhizobium sp. RU20A]|uniref:hypothetical protein n=1 Tax=Rhizobium sp. RU20A TaxID=1907412 RepID=UPI00122C746F|nr:hypothetical protein [Rhizobium sp. RU20A]